MSDYRKPEVRSDLRFLYRSALGRFFLKIATRPWLSKLAGRYLDSRFSRRHIKGFIKKNGINTAEVEDKEYRSFNDYFTRTLKPGSRWTSPLRCRMISRRRLNYLRSTGVLIIRN